MALVGTLCCKPAAGIRNWSSDAFLKTTPGVRIPATVELKSDGAGESPLPGHCCADQRAGRVPFLLRLGLVAENSLNTKALLIFANSICNSADFVLISRLTVY